jgi:hypothetical protein
LYEADMSPTRHIQRALIALAFASLTASAVAAGPLPKKVGQCTETTVKSVEYRLEGAPDSGSAISYANGGYQVSYEAVPAIRHSRRGDKIRLCLTELPTDCPKGDERGKIYRATNLRTGETWELPDSEHGCGGA